MPYLATVGTLGGPTANSVGGTVNREIDQNLQVKGNYYNFNIPAYYDPRLNSSYVSFSAPTTTVAAKKLYLKGLGWQGVPISSIPDIVFDISGLSGGAYTNGLIFDKDARDNISNNTMYVYYSIPNLGTSANCAVYRIGLRLNTFTLDTTLNQRELCIQQPSVNATTNFRFIGGGCYIPKMMYSKMSNTNKYYGGLIMVKSVKNGEALDGNRSSFFVINMKDTSRAGSSIGLLNNQVYYDTGRSTNTPPTGETGYCAGGNIPYTAVEVIPRGVTGWGYDFVLGATEGTTNPVTTSLGLTSWTVEFGKTPEQGTGTGQWNSTTTSPWTNIWTNQTSYTTLFANVASETNGSSQVNIQAGVNFVANPSGLVYYPIGKPIYQDDPNTEYERILVVDKVSATAVSLKVTCKKNTATGSSGNYQTNLIFTFLETVSMPGGGMIPTYLPLTPLTNAINDSNNDSYALQKYNSTDTKWYIRKQTDLFTAPSISTYVREITIPSFMATIVQDTDLNSNVFYAVQNTSTNNFSIIKLVLTKVGLTSTEIYRFNTTGTDTIAFSLVYLPLSLWNKQPKFGGLLISFTTRIIILEFDSKKNIKIQYDLGNIGQKQLTNLNINFYRSVTILPKVSTGYPDNLIFYYYNNTQNTTGGTTAPIQAFFFILRLDLDNRTIITYDANKDWRSGSVRGGNYSPFDPSLGMYFPATVKFISTDILPRASPIIIVTEQSSSTNYYLYKILYRTNATPNYYLPNWGDVNYPNDIALKKYGTGISLTTPNWFYPSTNSLLTFSDLFPTISGTVPNYYNTNLQSQSWIYRESTTSTRVLLEDNSVGVPATKSFTGVPTTVTNLIHDKDLDNNTYYGFTTAGVLQKITLPTLGGAVTTSTLTTMTGVTLRGGCYMPACMSSAGFGSVIVTDNTSKLNVFDFTTAAKTAVNTAYTVPIGYNAYAVEVIPGQSSGFAFHFGIAFGEGQYSTWIINADIDSWYSRTTFTYELGEGPEIAGNSIYFYPKGKNIYAGDTTTADNRIAINDNDTTNLYIYKVEQNVATLTLTYLSTYTLSTVGGSPYAVSVTANSIYNAPSYYTSSSDDILNYSYKNSSGTASYNPELKTLANSLTFTNSIQWDPIPNTNANNFVHDKDLDNNTIWSKNNTGISLIKSVLNKGLTGRTSTSYTVPVINGSGLSYIPSFVFGDGTSGGILSATATYTVPNNTSPAQILVYEFNSAKNSIALSYTVDFLVSSRLNVAYSAEIVPKYVTGWPYDFVISYQGGSTYKQFYNSVSYTPSNTFYSWTVDFSKHNATGWTNRTTLVSFISESTATNTTTGPFDNGPIVFYPIGKKIYNGDTATTHRIVFFDIYNRQGSRTISGSTSINDVGATVNNPAGYTMYIYNISYTSGTSPTLTYVTKINSGTSLFPLIYQQNLSQTSYNYLSDDYYVAATSGYWLSRSGANSTDVTVSVNSVTGGTSWATYSSLPANIGTVSQDKDSNTNIYYGVTTGRQIYSLTLPLNGGTITNSLLYTYGGSSTFSGSCYAPTHMWKYKQAYGAIVAGNNNQELIVMEFNSTKTNISSTYEISTTMGTDVTAVEVIPMQGSGFTYPYVIGAGSGKITYWISSFDTQVWSSDTPSNYPTTGPSTTPNTITFYPAGKPIVSGDTDTGSARITINDNGSTNLYVYTLSQSGKALAIVYLKTIVLSSNGQSVYNLTALSKNSIITANYFMTSSGYLMSSLGGVMNLKLSTDYGNTTNIRTYTTIPAPAGGSIISICHDKNLDSTQYFAISTGAGGTSSAARAIYRIIINKGTNTITNTPFGTAPSITIPKGACYVHSSTGLLYGAIGISHGPSSISFLIFNSARNAYAVNTISTLGLTNVRGMDVIPATYSKFTNNYVIAIDNVGTGSGTINSWVLTVTSGTIPSLANKSTTSFNPTPAKGIPFPDGAFGTGPNTGGNIIYYPPNKPIFIGDTLSITLNRIVMLDTNNDNPFMYVWSFTESGTSLTFTYRGYYTLGVAGGAIPYHLSVDAYNAIA